MLPEVADYIRQQASEAEEESENFPLHKYIHHGLSSQAMIFNLVGPLLLKRLPTPHKHFGRQIFGYFSRIDLK